jgi:hypothetical protein
MCLRVDADPRQHVRRADSCIGDAYGVCIEACTGSGPMHRRTLRRSGQTLPRSGLQCSSSAMHLHIFDVQAIDWRAGADPASVATRRPPASVAAGVCASHGVDIFTALMTPNDAFVQRRPARGGALSQGSARSGLSLPLSLSHDKSLAISGMKKKGRSREGCKILSHKVLPR